MKSTEYTRIFWSLWSPLEAFGCEPLESPERGPASKNEGREGGRISCCPIGAFDMTRRILHGCAHTCKAVPDLCNIFIPVAAVIMISEYVA
jgi:hypothetical protein